MADGGGGGGGVGLLCLEKLAFFRGGGLGGASEPSGESPGVIGVVQVVELPSAIEWLPLLLPVSGEKETDGSGGAGGSGALDGTFLGAESPGNDCCRC